MKEKIKLEELKAFYKQIIQGWMMGGLHTISKKELGENFIPALCCFVYTEAIGLYLPELTEEIEKSFNGHQFSPREKRFYRCLFRLESKKHLKECDEKIRDKGIKNGVYQLRHRFAHKYLPNLLKDDSQVRVFGLYNEDDLKKLQAAGLWFPVVFIEKTGELSEIIINNVKYIEELQKLVDYMYYKTFIEEDTIFVNSMTSGYEELKTYY